MTESRQRHFFPILDAMIEQGVREAKENGQQITCHAGCDHCCHLLVEISWEEAVELGRWVAEQAPQRRERFCKKIQEAAESAREVLGRRKKTRKYLQPYFGDINLPDDVYDEYFYEKSRPCPFLEDHECAAYAVRPSPCRLHMATSDPALCSREIAEHEDYNTPDELEEVKEHAGVIITALEEDGRWGQMAIMVEAVLQDLGLVQLPELTTTRPVAVGEA